MNFITQITDTLSENMIGTLTTSLAGFLTAAFFSMVLPKIFDWYSNKDIRDLKNIIDVKSTHSGPGRNKDPQLEELFAIYETRFILSLFHKFKAGQVYPGLNQWISAAGMTGIILGAFIVTSLFITMFLLQPVMFGIIAAIAILLIVRGLQWIGNIIDRKILSPFSYTATLYHPDEGNKTMEIVTVNNPDTLENVIFDFIGIPCEDSHHFQPENKIKIYRLLNTYEHPSKYVYERTRMMTLLEKEWYLKLNSLSRFGRKAPYIPFLYERIGLTYHTSCYMILKAAASPLLNAVTGFQPNIPAKHPRMVKTR